MLSMLNNVCILCCIMSVSTGLDCINYENGGGVVVVFMLIRVKCKDNQPTICLAAYRLKTTDDNEKQSTGLP